MNATTTRDDTRRTLGAVIAQHRNAAAAYRALAETIERLPAPVANYAPEWVIVVDRLRADADRHDSATAYSEARLRDLDEAEAAAGRWVPKRAEP